MGWQGVTPQLCLQQFAVTAMSVAAGRMVEGAMLPLGLWHGGRNWQQQACQPGH